MQESAGDCRVLDAVERKVCGSGYPERPPVFIVGPPRSGTTLLYQIMIKSRRFSYISNLAAVAPSLPGAVTKIFSRCSGPAKTLKRPRAGLLLGLWEPSEAGAIMKKWFGNKKPDTAEPAASVAAIERALGGAFLNKNTFNSARIENIGQVFPDALIAPFLSTVTTDSKYYRHVSDKIFRFVPIVLSREEVERIHGIDERISLENLGNILHFYLGLILSFS